MLMIRLSCVLLLLIGCSCATVKPDIVTAVLEQYPPTQYPYLLFPLSTDEEAEQVFNACELSNKMTDEAPGEAVHLQSYRLNSGVLLIRRLKEDTKIYPTGADEGLKEDVMGYLRTAEKVQGRLTVEVEQVRHLKDESELWILKAEGPGLAYLIKFKPLPSGGTEMIIKLGFRYVRDPAEARALVDKLR